ncbi:hypothetical protein LTH96_09620 [Nesterenkonia sp. LB17]|uniref:hypothetical protein n=1 Tax=unclassified Nesterenkonia TaxID=2629769 RepID=UPI001F4C9148|nr:MULTISPECIES: hypothetical protein [unclassified Nesterenkonia]MCH8560657.1 hypothetical protein [Nesterenkonia sp. DZ6]MCH8562935.1 hypothetical protein [Nesterenkonia sp. YGD6]MCH8565973.1 hypothetical protein [Nesterenkonia sp. LB17]MCH8570765.1 hypothetical protein [Nesterenkonia sp. AY15]
MPETNFQDEVLNKLRSLEQSIQRIEAELLLVKNYQQNLGEDHTDYATRESTTDTR